MSGPKTSRYTLTIEQRRILQEQMERERRIQEEISKIKRYISELRIISAEYTKYLEEAKELQKRTNNGREYISEIENIIENIKKKIEVNSIVSKETGLVRIEAKSKVLNDYLKEIREKSAIDSQKSKVIKEAFVQDINKGIDQGFLFQIPETIVNPKIDALSRLSEGILEKLNIMLKNPTLSQKLKNDLSNAIYKISEIKDLGFMKNFRAITFAEIQRKYNKYIEDYKNGKEIYDDLIIRYSALCEVAGINEKQIEFSAEAIDELKTEISKIEKQLVDKREESYISKCMDEVMAEMGYDVLGDRTVTKRSGKQFRNELYSFGEGTVVNVIYSSDGKITMELGGADKFDRLPTEAEVSALCEDMQSFCIDFVKIENKLNQKGVIVADRISILPPAPEYAQVINIFDYNLRTEKEIKIIDVKKRKGNLGYKKTLFKE